MPIGEIAGEVIGGIFRFIGRIFFEIFFEFFGAIIQGTGHVLLRLLRPKTEPGDMACAIVGFLFWGCVAAGGFWLYYRLEAS